MQQLWNLPWHFCRCLLCSGIHYSCLSIHSSLLKRKKYRKQVHQKQQTKTTSVLADEWKALKTFVYLFVAFILVSILPTSTLFVAKYLFGDIGFNLATIASFNMWSFPVVWDAFVIFEK